MWTLTLKVQVWPGAQEVVAAASIPWIDPALRGANVGTGAGTGLEAGLVVAPEGGRAVGPAGAEECLTPLGLSEPNDRTTKKPPPTTTNSTSAAIATSGSRPHHGSGATYSCGSGRTCRSDQGGGSSSRSAAITGAAAGPLRIGTGSGAGAGRS